jgi:hypothetical protein
MANFDYDTAWDDEAIDVRDVPNRQGYEISEFYPGERIGAAPPSRTRRTMRKLAGVAVIGSCIWVGFETRSLWQPWFDIALDRARSEIARTHVALPAPPAAAPTPSPPAAIEPLAAATEVATIAGTAPQPPPVTAPVLPQPQTDPASPAPPSTATPPSGIQTSSIEAEPDARLLEPTIDANDPNQKRASAAGLHPHVSKVLLSSMSNADYRNAATAIRNALAETADSDKYIWPRASDKSLAVFQVHFVTSASENCRRYIVTVVKNGWTTTAPPMEKCGIAKPRRSASAGNAAAAH